MAYVDRAPVGEPSASPAPHWVLDGLGAAARPPRIERRACGDWGVATLTAVGAEAVGIECRRCRAALELHQPVLSLPEQTLGTCAGCGAWHLIADGGDRLRILMIDFPEDGPSA